MNAKVESILKIEPQVIEALCIGPAVYDGKILRVPVMVNECPASNFIEIEMTPDEMEEMLQKYLTE